MFCQTSIFKQRERGKQHLHPGKQICRRHAGKTEKKSRKGEDSRTFPGILRFQFPTCFQIWQEITTARFRIPLYVLYIWVHEVFRLFIEKDTSPEQKVPWGEIQKDISASVSFAKKGGGSYGMDRP